MINSFFATTLLVSKLRSAFGRQKDGARRRRRQKRRTHRPFDVLEQRLLLTSMVQAAGILSIHLDANNEVLQLSSSGAGVYNLTTSGTFTDGGIAPSGFTGFGGSSGILTTSGVTQIQIDDTAGAVSGGQIIFNDSGVNPYAEIFTINLTNAAAGNIDFNGSSTFNGDLTASTTAGTLTVNAGATLNLNGSATTLQSTAAAGSVILNGTLAVTSASFNVNSANTISDSATAVFQTSASASSTFKITAGTHDILLNGGTHNFAGPVTIAQSGAGVVRDVALRNINPSATLPIVAGLAIRNYTLKFDNTAIQLPGGLTLTGNYVITSGGDITETGPLTGVRGTFTLLADNSIALNTAAGNTLTGPIAFNTPKADNTSAVSYIGSGAVQLGASSLGLGTFTVSALNGNLTQSGVISQKIGAAGTSLTIGGAGTQLALNTAGNRFEGPITLAGTATTINLVNASTLPSFPTLPAGVTTLTLNYANAPVTLPDLATLLPALDTMTITAQGVFQQAAASIKVATNATFTAGSNPILLNGASNDFNHLQVNNAGPNQVIINELNALDFGVGTSALGNGALMVTAGGAITQANRITQSVNAGITTFTSAAGNPITLTNASNQLRGIISLNTLGNANLTNNTSLTLGASNVGGNLTLNPNGNALSQDPGTSLTVGGNTTLSDAGGTVILDNNGNTFSGSVGVSAANATLRDASPFDFAASTVTASLTVHSGGAITQSAAIASATTLLDAGTAAITLNSANNFSGPVSLISTGAADAILVDTNAIQLGRIHLGSGNLSVTGTNISEAAGAANGITQAAGAGFLFLKSNGSISLNNPANSWTGAVDMTAATTINGLTLNNSGNVGFVGTPAIGGAVNLTSGSAILLPNAALNVNSFAASARTTVVSQNITTSIGGINFIGSVTLPANNTLNSSAAGGGGAGDITFNGDVNPAGPLTLTLGNSDTLLLNSGMWNQGANGLTINGNGVTFTVGNSVAPATFHMVSGTISMPGAGDFDVSAFGTFQVGGTSAAETVTLDNNNGNLIFDAGSTLAVGLGTTNDLLAKQPGDTGDIQINTGSRLTAYSGLAGASATPVLDAASGIIDTGGGFFDLTVDAANAAHVFLMGTDLVVPDYTSSQLTIIQGGTPSTTGIVNGIEPDSDLFTIKTTAAAQLVTAMNVNSQLDIVIRNAAGPVALAITTTRNLGDGVTGLGGIAIDGPGAATITAATSTVSDGILVQGNLLALSMNDFYGSSVYQTFIHAGGTSAQLTTITGRRFSNVSIDLPTVLNALTLADYANGIGIDTLTAERFGTIKTTGIAATDVTGDFDVSRLTSLNTLASTAPGVGAVTIANQLTGEWDISGAVTSVTALAANGWSLGLPGGANVRNGNLLGNVTTLSLGMVTNSNIQSIGRISTLTTKSWNGGTIQALSLGAIKTTGDAALGDFGDFSNVTLIATSNTSLIGLTSLTVAGNSDTVTLNIPNGNVASILVAAQLSNWTLTAGGLAPTLGIVTSLTAGAIGPLVLDANTVGTLSATGNANANLFGDIDSSTITIHSTPGSTAVALTTLKAARNFSNSTLVVQNGSVTSILVSRSITSTDISLLGSAGRLGTLSAAEWIFGGASDNLVAQSIGALSITGAPLSPLNSAKIVGDLSRINILAFGGGATAAIGALTVAGSMTMANNGFLRADNGITSFKVGRDVASAGGAPLISVRHVPSGTVTSTSSPIGRIAALTAGRWSSVDLAANTVGATAITGYSTPENPTPAKIQGNFTANNFVVPGSSGITSLNISGNYNVTNLQAPGGIGSLTALGTAGGRINADNPAGTAGRIGTLQLGEADDLTLRAVSIGALKTVRNSALAANGGINGGKLSISGSATGGSIAIGTVTIGFSIFSSAIFNVPRTITAFTVAEEIKGNSEIAAGYATGNQIASFTAGRLNSAVLTSNSIKTFNVIGKSPTINSGAIILPDVNSSTITLLSNVSGLGLGAAVIKGRVTSSDIHVAGGSVTSLTVGGMFGSDLLVGFHPPSVGNIAATSISASWVTSPGITFTLGSFTTTGLFNPADIADTATFRDSLVVAQKRGVLKISGLDPVVPVGSTTATFGIGFRTASGAGPSITVNGLAHPPGFISGAFSFLGLAG